LGWQALQLIAAASLLKGSASPTLPPKTQQRIQCNKVMRVDGKSLVVRIRNTLDQARRMMTLLLENAGDDALICII
jgi:hypothetical protein|tara:strand:- start:5298 stop:5525 length:228 start_codon:yes stop_codon:yes gene_type:complete